MLFKHSDQTSDLPQSNDLNFVFGSLLISSLTSGVFTFTFWRSFNPSAGELVSMAQATLDDDELFDEAASEMREDVEASLTAARDSLPDADEIWEVDSDNTLGVLNALRSALDTGDAEDALRDAKKWYTMGKKADAFDDADDLAEEIEAVGELIEDIEAAHEQVGELTSSIPQLRSALEEAAADADPDTDAEADKAEA